MMKGLKPEEYYIFGSSIEVASMTDQEKLERVEEIAKGYTKQYAIMMAAKAELDKLKAEHTELNVDGVGTQSKDKGE